MLRSQPPHSFFAQASMEFGFRLTRPAGPNACRILWLPRHLDRDP